MFLKPVSYISSFLKIHPAKQSHNITSSGASSMFHVGESSVFPCVNIDLTKSFTIKLSFSFIWPKDILSKALSIVNLFFSKLHLVFYVYLSKVVLTGSTSMELTFIQKVMVQLDNVVFSIWRPSLYLFWSFSISFYPIHIQRGWQQYNEL